MKGALGDRRELLGRVLALAGGAALAGCATEGVFYGGTVEYVYGPGWGSPWYGYDPFWDGPVFVGPPSLGRPGPGYPTTLPSFPSRPVGPANPPRPQLRPMPPPRPTPRPPPRPMPRGRRG